MFTLEEYRKLQTAASILQDKGLMQISPSIPSYSGVFINYSSSH